MLVVQLLWHYCGTKICAHKGMLNHELITTARHWLSCADIDH